MSKARTVIIGASHWHVPLYAQAIADRHEVLGASDPDMPRVEPLSHLWGGTLHSSWEELLANYDDIELAYVSAPHDTMRTICLALIERGVPLVVEKPAGISLHQVVEVRRAAEAAGVPIAVPLVQRGGPVEQWLGKAGSSVYESTQFIAGPPDRYPISGNPWMVELERAGGGCMINLAPHFVDLFLQSSGAQEVTVTAAISAKLHSGEVEDYASLTLATPDGRVATVQVGYAFPASPLKRHCAYMRIGAEGTATIWSDGSASFTSTGGLTETSQLNVDSDPLYEPFVNKVADQLTHGFEGLPGIQDLEATMTVVWDAYSRAGLGGIGVQLQH
ncbi:Gfo/Idh/MocA family protein [Rathayibacter soli]|uniref:Gfo/Idh/MocA family protein n=1 Tax=Rathayibacter soli TaxID=3144168 RepID=UPI0027E526A6|nr:Gfo/Idh/MocA family oxidoreductase [Glaciibacter superstes]